MYSFKEFIENQNQVDELIVEFNATPVGQFQQSKPWSAKKKEVLNMWKNIRPNLPILISPISKDGDSETYGEDGIRLTGSWNFISSVLSRLKDLVYYENPNSRLRLILRGIESGRDARPDRDSYVFYLNLEERGKGKSPKSPKGSTTNKAEMPPTSKPQT